MKEKVLFITNLLPYPLDNGGKIKTHNTLLILKDLFYVDLFCFLESKSELKNIDKIEKLGINVSYTFKKLRFNVFPLNSLFQLILSFFLNKPYSVVKYRSNRMRRLIRKKIKDNKYGFIYVDHLHLFQYIDKNLLREDCKVILDQHNVESEIIKRRMDSENNYFKKLFLDREFRKLEIIEKKYCKNASLVLSITRRDKEILMKLTERQAKIKEAPFFVQSSRSVINYDNENKNIVFLGTMSWYPNEDAALWFYKNVFKKFQLHLEGWHFVIVGNSPGKEILGLQEDKFVEVTGYVNDVLPYLSNAFVSIVPIRVAGGMRIKILELLSKGVPVISTKIGAEGIDLIEKENVIFAESPEEFHLALKMIENINFRKILSHNGMDFINVNYSFENAKQKFLKMIESI